MITLCEQPGVHVSSPRSFRRRHCPRRRRRTRRWPYRSTELRAPRCAREAGARRFLGRPRSAAAPSCVPLNVETDSADIIRSPGTPVTQGGPEVAPSAAESARLVTELFAEHHLGLVRRLRCRADLRGADVGQRSSPRAALRDRARYRGYHGPTERQRPGAVARPERPVRPRPVHPVRLAGPRQRAVHAFAGILPTPPSQVAIVYGVW